MDHFGGRNVSGIIGVLFTSVAVGTLIGPSAAGYAFDLSHSYTVPILASVAANLLAVAIFVGVPQEAEPTREIRGQAQARGRRERSSAAA